MYYFDNKRQTGRTTRMIDDALESFMDGWDIIITAFTLSYSLDIQNLMCYKMEAYGIKFNASKYIINVCGREMIFTRHIENINYVRECHYIKHNKTYLLFEDHYNGKM